ncbi:hypothetical protein KP509_27G037500 [Ceratopteris richardii]|nr:hypothetical protein KP509_27G037500 [Ceratopteris richardii]
MTGQCGFRVDGLLEDVEEMDRRQLGVSYLQARHISYGALSRDRVPCSRVGRSYYGCRGSGPVNPYRRYCSRITRCARDDS